MLRLELMKLESEQVKGADAIGAMCDVKAMNDGKKERCGRLKYR